MPEGVRGHRERKFCVSCPWRNAIRTFRRFLFKIIALQQLDPLIVFMKYSFIRRHSLPQCVVIWVRAELLAKQEFPDIPTGSSGLTTAEGRSGAEGAERLLRSD